MLEANPRRVVVAAVALLLLGAWAPAEADLKPASAEIVRATGRVEMLAQGRGPWSPVAVGARLVEGDQIRALAGGSADLNLPDGSTILVAENTRFAVTRLDYDAQSRERDAAFHLVAGKVRAQVTQAAVQLVRARRSNFVISTPTGVAAVRGTIQVIAHNPVTRETLVFVLPSPGQAPSAARATFVTRAGLAVTLTGGTFVRQVGNEPPGAPTPISTLSEAAQQALETAVNQATANVADLTAPIVVILSAQDSENLIRLVTAVPPGPTVDPTATGGGPTLSTSTVGQDVANQPQPTVCPTPPCP